MDAQPIEYRNEPTHIHVPRPSRANALMADGLQASSMDAVADPCSGADGVQALGEAA